LFVIQLSAFAEVAAVVVIAALIEYTLTTTPPPMPLPLISQADIASSHKQHKKNVRKRPHESRDGFFFAI